MEIFIRFSEAIMNLLNSSSAFNRFHNRDKNWTVLISLVLFCFVIGSTSRNEGSYGFENEQT